MGIIVGFQIILYGLLVEIYGVKNKFKKEDFFIKGARRISYRILFVFGFLIMAFGIGESIYLTYNWAHGGFGYYFNTRNVFHAIFFVLIGIQILFSSLIGSIFIKDYLRGK
jgi:hypothetical protein